jgi:hypothetical protein
LVDKLAVEAVGPVEVIVRDGLEPTWTRHVSPSLSTAPLMLLLVEFQQMRDQGVQAQALQSVARTHDDTSWS